MNSKPIAFVIMPFGEEFDAVFEQLIVPALSQFDVIRADTRLDQRSILEKIVTGVATASLVIADLTTLNANVMYELGIAHTLNRPTVMIAQSLAELPFDVRPYPVHAYSTQFQHATALTRRLQELGEAHIQGTVEFASPVADYLPKAFSGDTSPPSNKDPARPPQEAGVDGDYGRLDFEADLQEYGRATSEQLHKFGNLTNTLGDDLVTAAPILAAARRSSAPGSALEAKRIANDIAAKLDHYSQTLETEVVPAYHRALDGMAAALTWVTSPGAATNAAELKDLREAVELIDLNVDGAIAGVKAFHGSAAAVRGQTRELTRAAAKIENALDTFLSELALSKAYFARLLSRLKDASTKSEGSDDRRAR